MKLHFLLPIIVLISCKSTPKQVEVVNSEPESKWDLKTRTVYSNNLNSEGQPDTGYVTKYVYDNSNISDINKMQIIRRYRNSKLYSQKQFDISENGNYILTAENFRTYDFKGRPDSVILIKKGVLALKEKYKYDNEDRELQIISISNGSTDDEEDTKAASSTSYDSMKTDFVYDPDGKLISTKTTDFKGRPVHKEVYTFNGNDIVFNCSINDKGDTTQTTRYEKDGKFNKEIITIKQGAVVTRWLFLNKLMQLITEFSDGTKTKIVNRYNQRGILTETKTYTSK